MKLKSPDHSHSAQHSNQFLSGGGEMGQLIRSMDWSMTELGDVKYWPQSLRTAVSVCLNSRFPILIWWGKDLVKIYNDAYRPILGAKHPAMGAKGRDVWPEIWHIIGPMLKGVLEKGEATWSENQLLLMTRNGYPEEAYFTFSYSPIYDETGSVGGVFTAVTETTDKVIGERHLSTLKDLASYISDRKNVEEVYQNLAKALKQNPHDFPFSLIYKTEAEGKSATRITETGIQAGHPAAPDVMVLNHDAIWDIGTVVRENEPVVVDLTGRYDNLPSGVWNEVPKQALLMPITKSGKKHPYAVLIIGVNPHRLLNEKYLSFFKLLADQVGSEISNVISFEETRRQAEALAQIDKAKTIFFSNISHEFRTPLTLMLGPLEELIYQEEGKLSQKCWENIGTTYRNARRLLKLVNNLLDFSRIEAGRMQAEYRRTDVARLTADLAGSFRSIVESAGLQYEVKCAKINVPVYLDKEMWEKIVLNLLSNAFKYTLQGTISLSLKEENEHIVLRVKDTGIGIPEKELPHIFERFHRVQNVNGRSYEGSGIGLSLIHELVKLHYGTITVRSTEQKGSEFIVDLPSGRRHLPQKQVFDEPDDQTLTNCNDRELEILPDSTDLETTIPESTGQDTASENRGQSKKANRILIADDNADMRQYLCRLLDPDYNVDMAANGKQVLEKIKVRQPDLIISDIMMPVMNGLELLETLKHDRATAAIPFILLSARAGEEARIKGYNTGADDYLIKPFSAKELQSRVRSQLRIAQTRNHLESQMRNIFSQAYVAICILSGPDHIIEFANEQMLTVWKKSADEILGKATFDVFPEIIEQGFVKILGDVYHKGQRFVAHEVAVDLIRNGKLETTYLNFVYEPLREEDGTISGIIAVANEVTELVRSKQLVEKSEKQFRSLVMQSPVAMAVFKGKDMVVQLANKAMLKLWGKEGWDVQGMKHLELKPELLHQQFPAQMEEVYNTGIKYNENDSLARIETPEGPVDYYLNYQYAPLFESDGKTVSGLIATVVDVTEQAEAKKKIEQSENLYRQLVQGLPSAVYTCDAQGRILLFNEAAAELWGRKPELYKDKWCGSLRIFTADGIPVPPDTCPMAICLKEGRPMAGEIIIERPGGTRRFVQANAQPFFDAEGKVSGAVNMLIDITESKRAENALRESEERFRKVADTAPAMIWMTDANRLTYFFNKAWLNFTGRTLDEEKDRRWEENVHPDDLQRINNISGKAFEAHDPYYMEYRLRRHDDQYRWLAESAVPRFTPDDVFEGYIGSCMDIHDRKSASEVLEKRVDARTKALKRANEDLEKMNQELTAFAYISSHDLQEPLRKIQTFISRITDIERKNLSKKGLDYFNRIQNASSRMQQLIEDLLAYSRTNTDERTVEPVDLNNLLDEIKYELQEKIEEKKATIQFSTLPEVQVVRFQFHQLFMNLISNALKFSRPEVSPVITLKASKIAGEQINGESDKDYHHISISDNGIGFDPQYSKRIFELFQRLHGRSQYRGTGIGLAICKKIVENHDGIITAEGKPGEGSTFHIYLPVNT